MKKLLLCAFEPFGGETVNPAQQAAARVPDAVGDFEIHKMTVPTVFGKSVEAVVGEMERMRPDVVLCVGQAGGRFGISVERVAINIDDASIPDNAGNRPEGAPIAPDGPAAYFSNLPVRAMAQSVREHGLPADESNTAGTFVCNHLMYGVLHAIARSFPGMRGGFIHVPYAPVQAVGRSVPSMSVDDIARAVAAAIAGI